jgi:hypothetical protein
VSGCITLSLRGGGEAVRRPTPLTRNSNADCGPNGFLTAALNPNAFSNSVPAFHDVSSNAVLTPLNVRVNGQFILRSTPGVVNSEANVVSCSYTDPAGLFVEVTGVLTGR